MTQIPHDDILEGMYKLRIRESEKLKTVLELYDLEIHEKKLGPDCQVQTHEEAIVYVKELDKFLTMKVLENTPAVLSLGKLCDENGYSYEWINGQKPHLIKDGIRIICNTEDFVPIVVPGLSSSSSISSSTSRTPMKQESHSSSSSSSSSSSPTVGEILVREREDSSNSDISPVPVSELVDDRTGETCGKPKPTKYQKPIKKRPRSNGKPV